ncbi:MAG: hypothetical protein ACE5KM_03425 [Planctomycetaceae bacterium]
MTRRAARRETAPQSGYLQQVEYRATFSGTSLTAGRFAAGVRALNNASHWIDLGDCNLALGDLRGDGRLLTWGTTADDRVVAQIAANQREITGEWAATGEQVGRRYRFSLRLLPAVTSRLRLRVPAGWRVKTPSGDVTGPNRTKQPGWREWLVAASGVKSVRIAVVPEKQSVLKRPVRLLQGDVTYFVRASGLHIRSRSVFEVLNVPVRTIAFRLPRDVEVYSVSYGGETSLAFSIREFGRERRLVVHLPDPLIGQSRAVIVDAIAPTRLKSQWTLPRIDAVGALFLKGQLHLRVERPVELTSFIASGLRQSGALSRSPTGESLSFRRQLFRSTLQIRTTIPGARSSCRVVSQLGLTGGRWQVAGELTWSTRRGTLYAVHCTLADGWKLSSSPLRADGDGPDRDVNWTETRLGNGRRRLTFELPNALGTGQSVTLRLRAERLLPGRPGRLQIPIVPDRVREVEQAVLIPPDVASDELPTNAAASYELISPSRVPAFVRESTLWSTLPAGAQASTNVLYARSRTPGRIVLQRESDSAFDAVAWSTCRMQNGTIDTHLAITVEPADGPIDSVLVYQSQPGELRWSVASARNDRLAAIRLSRSRHAELKLPPGGELWQVKLPNPVRNGVKLLARRLPNAKSPEHPPLVLLPHARRFTGYLEFSAAQEVRFETRGLFAFEPSPKVTKYRPPGIAPADDAATFHWRYRTPASLTLQRASSTRAANRQLSLGMELWSVLSTISGARDRHRAVFRLASDARRGEFAFQLGDSATIVSATLNGAPTAAVRIGRNYVIQSLPADTDNVIEIRYTCASQDVGLKTTAQIVVPFEAGAVRDFRWHFAVPPNTRAASSRTTLVVSPAVPPPGWGRRVFGPLASVSSRGVFNPFSVDSWNRLLDLRAPDDLGRTATSDDNAWAPSGWTVFTAGRVQRQRELTVELSDDARGRLWSWLGLLACFVLVRTIRRKRPRFRGTLAAWWFGGCLAAAWLVPPEFAEIAGGCLVGSLLAAVLPRQRKRRTATRDVSFSGIPVGSTVSYPRVVSSVLPAGLCLLAAGSLAASVPPVGKRDSVDREAVIVSAKPSVQDVVYLHRALLGELRRAAAPRVPRYVLRSARYEVEAAGAGSANVTAAFEIVSFAGTTSLTVLLPLRGAHLCGPAACRVNGRVHPVRRDDAGRGFLLDLSLWADGKQVPARRPALSAVVGSAQLLQKTPPAPRVVRVELCLRVPLARRDAGDALAFQIPRVLNGSVTLRLPNDGRALGLPGLTVLRHDKGWFQQTISARTGAAETLEVRRGTGPAATMPAPRITARVQGIAEVGAAVADVKIRASYRIESGSINSIPWSIPNDWVLRRIRLEGDETQTLNFRVVKRTQRLHELRVDLPQSQSQSFVLSAECVVPTLDSRGAIRISVPRLHDATSIKETGAQFGINASAEYELQLGPADSIALRELDAKTRDELRQAFPSSRALQIAFDVRKPTRLQGRLGLRPPRRSVRRHQITRVHRDRLDVTWTADVAVTAAPVFLHKLRVDPRLTIDSIRVIEDRAPRLVRWSRAENFVWLFLSNDTTATQQIVLRGTMPLSAKAQFRLPAISFVDAETKLATLAVYRDRTMGVEIADPGDAKRTESALIESGPAGDVLVGGFNVTPGGNAPQLRTHLRWDSLRAERLTVLRRDSRRQSSLTCVLRFRDRLPASTYAVRIPERVIEQIRIDETAWTVVQRIEESTGSTWLLRPVKPGALPPLTFHVDVAPDNVDVWDVPLPKPIAARPTVDILAIDDALKRFSVDSRSERVAAEDVPRWMRTRIPAAGASLFRSRLWRWRVSAQRAARQSLRPRVPLMETELWCGGDDGVDYGRTKLYVVTGASMTMSWPADLELLNARVDGRPVADRPDRSGRWKLRFQPGSVHQVRLDWKRNSANDRWGVSKRRRAIPVPLSLNVEASLIAVRSGPGTKLFSPSGVQRIERIAFLLDRFEHLIAIAQQAPRRTIAARHAFVAAVNAERGIASLLDRQSRDGGAPDPEIATRFKRAGEQIQSLKKQFSRQPGDDDVAVGPFAEIAQPDGDAEFIRGRLEMAGEETAVKFRRLGRLQLSLLLAAAVLIVVIPFVRRLFQLQLGDKLAAHESVSWMLLGIAWLLFLAPGVVGLLLLGVAAWKAVRKRLHAPDVDNVIQLVDRSA